MFFWMNMMSNKEDTLSIEYAGGHLSMLYDCVLRCLSYLPNRAPRSGLSLTTGQSSPVLVVLVQSALWSPGAPEKNWARRCGLAFLPGLTWHTQASPSPGKLPGGDSSDLTRAICHSLSRSDWDLVLVSQSHSSALWIITEWKRVTGLITDNSHWVRGERVEFHVLMKNKNRTLHSSPHRNRRAGPTMFTAEREEKKFLSCFLPIFSWVGAHLLGLKSRLMIVILTYCQEDQFLWHSSPFKILEEEG